MRIIGYLFLLIMVCLIPIIMGNGYTVYAENSKDLEEINAIVDAGRKLADDSIATSCALMRIFHDGSLGEWIGFEPESTACSVAEIYFDVDRIFLASFAIFAPSGDWVEYTDNYYRADGSLVYVLSDFRTFHGDVKIESDIYYGSTGEVLDSIITYYDLHSGEKLEEEPSYYKTERYQDVFKTTDELIDSLGNDNLFPRLGEKPDEGEP